MARTCDFVPIKVDFPKDGVKDTIFQGQKSLKLVVQCAGGGEYEQYVLREYLAYKIYNVLAPARSMRARLAKVTYVDQATDKTIGVRSGIFLEDDSDVAKRMGGRAVELQRITFKDVHPDTLELAMMFEYMIGNTDVSLYALHNLILVQMPDRSLYTVPYDFDLAGLVHPPYAIPARGLPIKTVQERLFRGPCKPVDAVNPTVANFVAKQDEIMGLADRIPDVDKGSKEEVKSYLNAFYSSIKNEKEAKRIFTDNGCLKSSTM
jgi:hypothetical protein